MNLTEEEKFFVAHFLREDKIINKGAENWHNTCLNPPIIILAYNISYKLSIHRFEFG